MIILIYELTVIFRSKHEVYVAFFAVETVVSFKPFLLACQTQAGEAKSAYLGFILLNVTYI